MSDSPPDRQSTKAERRAARALVATYHEAKIAELIEHVRAGIARYGEREREHQIRSVRRPLPVGARAR